MMQPPRPTYAHGKTLDGQAVVRKTVHNSGVVVRAGACAPRLCQQSDSVKTDWRRKMNDKLNKPSKEISWLGRSQMSDSGLEIRGIVAEREDQLFCAGTI